MTLVQLERKKVVSGRPQQIFDQYILLLDEHIKDLKAGKEERAKEIHDFAEMMHIDPRHLSNTIKDVSGKSTCSFYEERLVRASKELLLMPEFSIGQVAEQLTYDPSNFTKFFKKFTGITPKQFRIAYFSKI